MTLLLMLSVQGSSVMQNYPDPSVTSAKLGTPAFMVHLPVQHFFVRAVVCELFVMNSNIRQHNHTQVHGSKLESHQQK